MKKPKKETRDVIAKHVRWTEALRVPIIPKSPLFCRRRRCSFFPVTTCVPLSLLWWASSVVRSMRGWGSGMATPRHAASGRCGCFSATTSIITRAASVPRNLTCSSKTCSMCIRLRGRYVRMRLRYHFGPPPYNHVKKYTFPDLTLCLVNVYTVITVNIYFSCVILI